MDTLILAATKSTSSGSSSVTFLFIIVLIVLMMLFMFRSNRRRQQNAQNTQRQVQIGARVRTVHGIYGTVRGGDDQNVMVEVAPGVQIKMLRQAVGTVLPDDTPDGVLNTMPEPGVASSTDHVDEQSDGDDESADSQQRSDLSR
jgi:preprotein translocase subunit YajC